MFTKESFELSAKLLSGRSSFENIMNETRYFSASTAEISIFLSHSHYDMKYVKIARAFFEQFGVKVYVDWADDTMPKTTSGETASKIKTKIHTNKFFILLATDIALYSKWCNWEVGIADLLKYRNDKIAILPISDERDKWKGNEYLQLYPEIMCDNMNRLDNISSYFVKYPDGRKVLLENWLKL